MAADIAECRKCIQLTIELKKCRMLNKRLRQKLNNMKDDKVVTRESRAYKQRGKSSFARKKKGSRSRRGLESVVDPELLEPNMPETVSDLERRGLESVVDPELLTKMISIVG